MAYGSRRGKGSIIRNLRVQKSLSPKGVAKSAGVTLSVFKKAENGKDNILGEYAQKIADALGEPIDYLFGPPTERSESIATSSAVEFMILPDQSSAERETIERLKGNVFKTAVLVDFTPHLDRGFLSHLIETPGNSGLGIKQIKLIFGSVAEAIRLESQRQAHLLSYNLRDLDTDFPTALKAGEGKLTGDANNKATEFPDACLDDVERTIMVIHHNLPTSFRGFRIDDEVVCLGWSVWLPTFNDCNKKNIDNRLISHIDSKYNMGIGAITDRLTMNGGKMPHVLAFNQGTKSRQSPYMTLSAMFNDYVEAISHYWDLHHGRELKPPQTRHPDLSLQHPDLSIFPNGIVPNPTAGVKRIDPRSEGFWSRVTDNRGGAGEKLQGMKTRRNRKDV
jgi:transcriptional regulator with XRE-family HTH domain